MSTDTTKSGPSLSTADASESFKSHTHTRETFAAAAAVFWDMP